MDKRLPPTVSPRPAGVLRRLARDRAGNTFAMVAAAVTPLLAMVGGGIDMGRSYLSESRLQQACDAGVLATRKRLGSSAAVDGAIPDEAILVGNRFFNLNFRDGAYGTEDRTFTMTLKNDYSIAGVATVNVPTTIMHIFGNDNIPVHVECQASLNFSNTDVMMVLDTTGSMKQTLSGDTTSKIDALRNVVSSFYTQLEASKPPGTRIRYGFVPYSVNVNVGFLLKSGWLVDEWTYQGRESFDTGETSLVPVYSESTSAVSGTYEVDAVYNGSYCPTDTAAWIPLSFKISGKKQTWRYQVDGTSYSCKQLGPSKFQITPTTYSDYVFDYIREETGKAMKEVYVWKYKPMTFDVSFIKDKDEDKLVKGGHFNVKMDGVPDSPKNMSAFFRGCIEERSTYEITDYDDVDLSQALDLDIDTVPTPGDPDTQWRPIFNEISWLRSLKWDGTGDFTPGEAVSQDDFSNANDGGFSVCPAEALKLAEIKKNDLDKYLNSLVPAGNTYHDIGMIWGGRLLSPTGIFADENADLDGIPTSRNLIFLTDGETAPRDVTYGAYGIEPLDQRRWSEYSSLTLTQVVERRFAVACNEVKKRNITVWVIGFGTKMTDMLKDCAGDGHWFQADDAEQLNEVFSTIASSIGELRISK